MNKQSKQRMFFRWLKDNGIYHAFCRNYKNYLSKLLNSGSANGDVIDLNITQNSISSFCWVDTLEGDMFWFDYFNRWYDFFNKNIKI